MRSTHTLNPCSVCSLYATESAVWFASSERIANDVHNIDGIISAAARNTTRCSSNFAPIFFVVNQMGRISFIRTRLVRVVVHERCKRYDSNVHFAIESCSRRRSPFSQILLFSSGDSYRSASQRSLVFDARIFGVAASSSVRCVPHNSPTHYGNATIFTICRAQTNGFVCVTHFIYSIITFRTL